MGKTREKTRLELRFVGGGVSPATVSAGELAELLTSLESGMAELLGADPKETLVLSLVQITNGSAALAFVSPTKRGDQAFERIALAAKNGDVSGLPAAAREAPRRVLSFVKRRNCTAEWRKGQARPIATTAPETVLSESSDAVLRGETTLYGYVIRVGGEDPRVRLRYSEKHPPLSCDVSEALAKEVGRRLYSWVGLVGTAEWSREDNTLLSFHATAILPYEGSPAAAAVSELSGLIGEHWDETEDVGAAVSNIRGLKDL